VTVVLIVVRSPGGRQPHRTARPGAWHRPGSRAGTQGTPRSASSAAHCWRSSTVRPTRGGRNPPAPRH